VFDAANQRTRPNLKVQDGCDNRCSFCVIPFVRGQSRSLPLGRILSEIDSLVAAGFREVVISGINLGRWGRDLEVSSQLSTLSQRPTTKDQRPISDRRPSFPHLVRAVLDRTTLEKLRISSVEPMDWSDELIALVGGSPRIAKHAHVPMQSGSDAVLRRMHRKYRPWHYREKIEKIRTAMPDAAIGADVMVGFPGETDAEFEETRRMIEQLPFTYLHVFTFSSRPGTPAAKMPNQVPVHIARERNRILRELAAEKKQRFLESFVGRTVDAITLGRHQPVLSDHQQSVVETGRATSLPANQIGIAEPSIEIHTEALTDSYLSLLLPGNLVPNQWVKAEITGIENGKLLGEPVASLSPPVNVTQSHTLP
jgi:threonylcarbamoyladenosine tRNA methylthiotransferase MtaB